VFNSDFKAILKEKIAYELWLLEFIIAKEDAVGGSTDATKVILFNHEETAKVCISCSDTLGGEAALEVLDFMMPLSFIVVYKIIDIIFETILEENYAEGIIDGKRSPARWAFEKKIENIKLTDIKFPPFFQEYPYVLHYFRQIYIDILEFRHEIVHRNQFKVSHDEGKMTVVYKKTETGEECKLDIPRVTLGHFIRSVVLVANVLNGDKEFGKKEDVLFKYYWDRTEALHNLPLFNQDLPVEIDVELNVIKENGKFPVDLNFVRRKLAAIMPGANVLFNLTVNALENDSVVKSWCFDAGNVPNIDVMELTDSQYDCYGVG
jgi:hypothetical protein